MEYLNYVLGIQVIYLGDTPKPLPNFIHSKYRVQMVTLDGIKVVFLYPKKDLDAVSAVKKHIALVRETEGVPVTLVPERLEYRQKEYLLREHIPFVVEKKQIYLPFMGVYLQERCDGERQPTNELLPSAQLLLLYYIYQGCREVLSGKATSDLGFTATSISRASGQLEGLGLIQTEKRGVQKILFSDLTPKELFAAAFDYFRNPVKRTIYVPKSEVGKNLPMSGYLALSEYSMLNPPTVCSFASAHIAEWEKSASDRVQDYETQCAIELWRYDPMKLASGQCVDRLSLALSLRDDSDERIEEAVNEMLEQVWEEIDGQRH